MTEQIDVAVDIVDATVADLEDMGCDPIERAIALLTAGLAELERGEDLGEVLLIHRLVLERIRDALLEVGHGSSRVH